MAKLEKAGFTADEILHIYELPFKLTLDVRLSVFQFKINHNILYTKSRLFRDKITENDKCYLCSGSQTLVHLFALFADCVCSKVFWTDFTSSGGIVKITRKSGSNSVTFYICISSRRTVLFRHQLLFARRQKLHLYFGKK